MTRSKKITRAARGQDCTLGILGVCNNDPATVVFCHFPSETHGMGIKAADTSGGFGCSACHDAIDGRTRCEELDGRKDWYMRRSQSRTLDVLFAQGIIKIA